MSKNKYVAYGLWLTLGTFGAHRFYFKKKASGYALLFLSLIQIILIPSFDTFWRIVFFWPPFNALINIVAFASLLGFLPSYDSVVVARTTEDAAVNVAIPTIAWLLTLPALIVTVWTTVDGAFIRRWFRECK